jgi:hypothetical protein
MSNKNSLDYSDEHNPQIIMEVGGYGYCFTIRDVEKEAHQWLLGVISRQMQEVHDRATAHATKEIQDGLQKLLGLSTQK